MNTNLQNILDFVRPIEYSALQTLVQSSIQISEKGNFLCDYELRLRIAIAHVTSGGAVEQT